MSKLVGDALWFFLEHFDEAEALRTMVHEDRRPAKLSDGDWDLVKAVLSEQSDQEACELLDVVRRALKGDIGAARLDFHTKAPNMEKYWATRLKVGRIRWDDAAFLVGVAIDEFEKGSPSLCLYVDFDGHDRDERLDRAFRQLTEGKFPNARATEPHRGWTGQVVFSFVPLKRGSGTDLVAEVKSSVSKLLAVVAGS